MIGLGLTLTMTMALAWAAMRCPLGRALALGMNFLAEASRDPRGMLD